MEPLRQEVESVIAESGWTKLGLTRMRKLDSFLKETMRVKSSDSKLAHGAPSLPHLSG